MFNLSLILILILKSFVNTGPGVASIARYRVLIDKRCLCIYSCGMAAHFWWITHASSLRFSCSRQARTLHFSSGSIWFKCKTFCTLFATSIISYCASSHVTWCVVPYQHHTEICTDIWRRKSTFSHLSFHSFVNGNVFFLSVIP